MVQNDDFLDKQTSAKKSIEKWKEEVPLYAIDFINSLLEQRAITTCREYAGDLRLFFNYLQENIFEGTVPFDISIEQICTITDIHIIEFLNNKEIRTSVYNRRLSSLKRFFQYLQYKGFIDTNPTLLLHKKGGSLNEMSEIPIKVKTSQYQINYLINELNENYNNSTLSKDESVYKELRDLVLVKLITQVGLKIYECINLNIEDLDLEHGLVKVKRKSHYVLLPLEQSLINLFQIYLENRLQCTSADTDALFLSCKLLKRLTYWGMNKVIKSYQLNGIPNITSHDLRKYYATKAYEANTNIEFISDTLGCQSIDMVKKLYF